jgi:hypothetical protein
MTLARQTTRYTLDEITAIGKEHKLYPGALHFLFPFFFCFHGEWARDDKVGLSSDKEMTKNIKPPKVQRERANVER